MAWMWLCQNYLLPVNGSPSNDTKAFGVQHAVMARKSKLRYEGVIYCVMGLGDWQEVISEGAIRVHSRVAPKPLAKAERDSREVLALYSIAVYSPAPLSVDWTADVQSGRINCRDETRSRVSAR